MQAVRTCAAFMLVSLCVSSAACAEVATGTARSAWQPSAMFVQGGRSGRETQLLGLGLRWDGSWRREFAGGTYTGSVELGMNHWSARAVAGERRPFVSVHLVPLLRWSGTDSDWFVEGGIGLSLHDKPYAAGNVQMSTRWNFHDTIAVGRSIGAAQRQEIALRLLHVSNAGIRRPNPGDNVVLLRWTTRF